MSICVLILFIGTMIMCVLVVIRTYICTYLAILLLNSFDAFANIEKRIGYLNKYIINVWYIRYFEYMQILIRTFLSYNSTYRLT